MFPHHTALSVRDLNRSVAWYQDVLGFREIQRFEKPEMNAQVSWLKQGEYILELFEIKESSPVPEYRKELVSDLRTQGTKHFAVGVKDIAVACAALQAKNVKFSFLPRIGASGCKYAFFQDPDGILIEIIESKD